MLSDVSKDLESKTKIKERAKLLGPKVKASRWQGQQQKSMLTTIRKFICTVKTWQTPMTSQKFVRHFRTMWADYQPNLRKYSLDRRRVGRNSKNFFLPQGVHINMFSDCNVYFTQHNFTPLFNSSVVMQSATV